MRVIKVGEGAQPEGVPFYLPRPYVQVFEPFVIGSKAYLVSGQVSPDEKYLLIDNVSDRSALDGLFRADPARESAVKVPAKVIRKAGAMRSVAALAGQAQGGLDAEAAAPPAPAASSPAPAAAGAEPLGQFNVSVSNTSAQFAPTLGRRFFDVVWMPDFDEKYVVQGRPGLGNANIGITLTQGWGLYGLDTRVDNAALVKPLLDVYSTSLDALGKLARSSILPADALTGRAQGGAEAAELPAGARVTVKVTRVQVVAPGLYPILKPTEASTADAHLGQASDLSMRHLPRRPYTNIAFNTYEVVVVEAARPAGDTPMNLQRYFDVAEEGAGAVSRRAAVSTRSAGSAETFDAAAFQKQVNELLANRKGSGGEFWQLSDMKVEGELLKGVARLVGGSNKPERLTTMVELANWVAKQPGSSFMPGNVKLTEAKP